MNCIESDADLSAACRARVAVLNQISALPVEELEEAIVETEEPFELRQRLAEINEQIARAVTHHLLNPPLPRDEIAVLPRWAR
jgi:hypothetical protein